MTRFVLPSGYAPTDRTTGLAGLEPAQGFLRLGTNDEIMSLIIRVRRK